MFYRVWAVLPFRSEDEARDFYHDCEVALAKAETINPGTPDEERGHIMCEHCHHDTQVNEPCELIDEDFTA